MRFQQFNIRRGRHLRGDNRCQVILHIQCIDRSLRSVTVIADLHRPFKKLVFRPFPMKAYTYPHVVQQHAFRPLFPPYIRCSQYAYADVHVISRKTVHFVHSKMIERAIALKAYYVSLLTVIRLFSFSAAVFFL